MSWKKILKKQKPDYPDLDGDGDTNAVSNLRVIRRAPWDTGVGASVGETDTYPWYEVRINMHMDNYVTATVTG